jgi:hypothetical protein
MYPVSCRVGALWPGDLVVHGACSDGGRMQAAYCEAFGGPENLTIGERPEPVPDPGQMLVRIHAAGVGIWDVGMMHGGGVQASLPRIPDL